MSYGLSFASISATIVHTILYLRKSISTRIKGGIGERPDIHARLMSVYTQGMLHLFTVLLELNRGPVSAGLLVLGDFS